MAKEKPKRKPTRPKIGSRDAQLFGSLYKANRPLSIKKLAQRTDMSWQTADQHIKKLAKLNILKLNKSVRKTSVSMEPSWVEKVRKKLKR